MEKPKAQLHEWTLCLQYPPLKILWFLTVSRTKWAVWRCHIRLCENVVCFYTLCSNINVWQEISNLKTTKRSEQNNSINFFDLAECYCLCTEHTDILPLFSQAQAFYLTGHLCYLILQPLRAEREEEDQNDETNEKKRYYVVSFKEQNFKGNKNRDPLVVCHSHNPLISMS